METRKNKPMTSTKKPTQDQYELALVVRHLVRFRHQQGESAVEGAVKEAAGLEWRFCQACGTEEPYEGSACIGCGQRSVAPVCLKRIV